METAAAVAILPDDSLAEVLRRLPARSLAASRCVCKAWRAVVDEQQLLLRHLLPHSVRGLFVNYMDHYRPHFFSRPTAAPGPRIDGELGFIPRENRCWAWYRVLDHCNGFVLLSDVSMHVCNPATRRWARLPPCSADDWKRRAFVVFDPAVSPHYEVLLAPLEAAPAKRWTWHVLSSTTNRWEERVFVREGEAAESVAGSLPLDWEHDMYDTRWRFAAYWQGALYVHCRGEFVSRLSLSNDTCKVIKSPIDLDECNRHARSFIGKSKDGVYFAALDDMAHLRVWILNESEDKTTEEWLLKHHSVLNSRAWRMSDREKYNPWIMDVFDDETRDEDAYDDDDDEGEEDNVCDDDQEEEGNVSDDQKNDEESEDEKVLPEHKADWDSDDDNVIDKPDNDEGGHVGSVDFLGFHPYKDVIFLGGSSNVAVAYHLNDTKVQYLGVLNINTYNRGYFESFVYTPCLIGD